jgi:hypothetical protein
MRGPAPSLPAPSCGSGPLTSDLCAVGAGSVEIGLMRGHRVIVDNGVDAAGLLRRDPLGGHLFCFRGRSGYLLKVIGTTVTSLPVYEPTGARRFFDRARRWRGDDLHGAVLSAVLPFGQVFTYVRAGVNPISTTQ